VLWYYYVHTLSLSLALCLSLIHHALCFGTHIHILYDIYIRILYDIWYSYTPPPLSRSHLIVCFGTHTYSVSLPRALSLIHFTLCFGTSLCVYLSVCISVSMFQCLCSGIPSVLGVLVFASFHVFEHVCASKRACVIMCVCLCV